MDSSDSSTLSTEIRPAIGNPITSLDPQAGVSTYSFTLSSSSDFIVPRVVTKLANLSSSTGISSIVSAGDPLAASSVMSSVPVEADIRSTSSSVPTATRAPVQISPSEIPGGSLSSVVPSTSRPLEGAPVLVSPAPLEPTAQTSKPVSGRLPDEPPLIMDSVTVSSAVPSRSSIASSPATIPPVDDGAEPTSSTTSGSAIVSSSSRSSGSQVSTSSVSGTAGSTPSVRPPVSSTSSSVSSRANTITSVTVVPISDRTLESTSTLFVDPVTTLSSAVPVTITSDGVVATSTPPFVTVVVTSTDTDGTLVVHTEIAANPDFLPSPGKGDDRERGILDNKGAAAGIFVTIGVVTAGVSFVLFMIWRRRRRTDRRKQWFAGMREQRTEGSPATYPFGGNAGFSSNRSSGFGEGLTVETTGADAHGGGLLSWGRRQPSPPNQHYRPHSTLPTSRGYNFAPMPFPEPMSPFSQNDSMSSLGLTGIGAGMQGNTSSTPLRGLPSPVRKPVSAHLYDDDLKELDNALGQSDANNPQNTARTKFGLSPIHEAATPRDEYSEFSPATLPVPPSYNNYHPRKATSPSVTSSPSLYPPTLPADDDAEHSPNESFSGESTDDSRNPFSSANAVAPPRPPRSKLRNSTGKAATFSLSDTPPSPASLRKHDPSEKAKMAQTLENLFNRIHGTSVVTNRVHEVAPLTPPSSTSMSPIQEKRQDILINRKTLLDVRPRSLRSDTSSP